MSSNTQRPVKAAAVNTHSDTLNPALPQSIDATMALLAGADYVAERSLATAVFLSLRMGRPLFLEGEAGVGKTEIAKVLASTLGRRLVRLQCYEGLDIAQAAYEWNYPRQMIEIRLAEAEGAKNREALTQDIFSEKFLIRRPLLQALQPDEAGPPVLLIDELDRTDEPFEAYLLEVLSDFQITVPEVGTYRATEIPVVVLTSNRTRDVHDALKRRCLYHWVEHPGFEREVDIVRLRVPQVHERLARQVAGAVERLRTMHLYKPPGVAETIDWATALGTLGVTQLDESVVRSTLGTVLKYREDHERVNEQGVADLVKHAFERATIN